MPTQITIAGMAVDSIEIARALDDVGAMAG